MAKKTVHVVPHQGDWAVRVSGNKKISSVHATQNQAVQAGKGIAIHQQTDLVIHRPNGQIRDKDSYGPDPCPPEDNKH